MIWLLSHHLRKNHCNRQIQCLCKKRWLCFHSFHCPEFAEKMKILSYKEKHIYHLWFIVSNLICLLSIVWISLCLKISEIKIYIYIYMHILFLCFVFRKVIYSIKVTHNWILHRVIANLLKLKPSWLMFFWLNRYKSKF